MESNYDKKDKDDDETGRVLWEAFKDRVLKASAGILKNHKDVVRKLPDRVIDRIIETQKVYVKTTFA